MNIIPTVGVLIFKNNKVLLVKHGEKASHVTGSYGFPAGRLEEGETKKQAAVRELLEETGLMTTEDNLEELLLNIVPADIKRKSGEIQRFSITIFMCRHFSGELQETEETIPEWVELEKLGELDLEHKLLPNILNAVRAAQKGN